ncbi:MAG: diaminopimelate decarboxylase, partial [Clostridia bacterium]|nr:diaminopimelate decarboxylase [Clostridia bacterium]
GSQIFDIDPFVSAADIMFRFIKDIKDETGIELEELNLGGGLGVPYVDTDPVIDYEDCIRRMADQLKKTGSSFGLKMPKIILEPGRSIVAAAGVTLYTVGSFKNITGYKSYVSIDGGMPDNPRYALYNSQYSILVANKANEEKTVKCTVAGRCCESGDLIAEDIMLQRAERGDILAVLVTGAYNHSMASNYNKIPRPPVIIIKDGEPRVAIKRETFEDLIRNDL